MAGSVNKVILIGNCGRDPEVRYAPSGAAICNVSIATSSRRKDKASGETIEDTQWHRVTFYDRLAEIAGTAFVPLIAINDVLYHAPECRALQDVVTCIREHTTLESAGRTLEANAERHLKSPEEMTRLFRRARVSEAIGETIRFLKSCRFSLEELKDTEYADETRQGYATPQEALVAFAEEGYRRRFPNGAPPHIRHALDEELRLIGKLKYAPFFLTVHEIVTTSGGTIDVFSEPDRGACFTMIWPCSTGATRRQRPSPSRRPRLRH